MALIPNLLYPRTSFKYYSKSLLFSLFDSFNLRKATSIYSSLSSLRSYRRSDVCVVIAGGPSFCDQAAHAVSTLQSNFDVFTINRFYCNPVSSSINSTFHLVSDPGLILEESNHEALYLLHEYINTSTTKLLVPYNNIFTNEFPECFYFNDIENLLSANIHPLYPRGYPSNSAFKALAISTFLSYKRIYIFGLDYDMPHSLSVSSTNELIFSLKHHFKSEIVSYSHLYDSFAHALHSWSLDFHHLRKFSKYCIFNVSTKSLVDTFPKLTLDQFYSHF